MVPPKCVELQFQKEWLVVSFSLENGLQSLEFGDCAKAIMLELLTFLPLDSMISYFFESTVYGITASRIPAFIQVFCCQRNMTMLCKYVLSGAPWNADTRC